MIYSMQNQLVKIVQEAILEVDIEYPDELHELRNDSPLAPEKLDISHDILSNYCSYIGDKYGVKFCCVNKLVPNFDNKFLH